MRNTHSNPRPDRRRRHHPGDSVQSLARGLEVLRLLALHGRLTASQIASELSIHQSSASRQLRSLQDAGLVYKPDFHSFALDYGVLHLAGVAMAGFSEIGAAIRVCTRIHRETGYGSAAAVVRDGRLIYLARVAPHPDASLVLVSDSDYPVCKSSLGLAISYAQYGMDMAGPLREAQGGDTVTPETLTALSAATHESFTARGFLYLHDFGGNRFNAAGLFSTSRGPAALAIHSGTACASPELLRPLIERSIEEIEHELSNGKRS